jgi:hypothetical protein
MKFSNEWSRRRFLAVSSAAAAQAAATLKGLSQTAPSAASAAAAAQRNIQEAARLMPPPEIISGGIQPLMHSMTARPLRYRPIAGDFVIRNGAELFNRPLYAPCSTEHSADFRVDASDVPEFSLYLPGHGGNLKLGFIAASGAASKWAAVADEVVARYRPGRMIYELRDSLLGTGSLRAELITAAEGSGIILKVEGSNLPSGTRLAWAFGGVSGKKGRRNGDIGCEVQPVSQFFQVTAEECDGNQVALVPALITAKTPVTAIVSGKAASITLIFPSDSADSPVVAAAADFKAWNLPPATDPAHAWSAKDVHQPILIGSAAIKNEALYIGIYSNQTSSPHNPEAEFPVRSAQLESLAATLTLDTPDEYLNTLGPALAVAAETIWDAHAQCVLHGGVAWRTMLAGWRGPYSLDALGNHDRAQQHFRHWLKRQNLTPVATADPAIGPWDDTPNFHLTRKEKMLHSNGDLSGNHYDMNMVFMDVLMRHLMWTGDLDFAREIWPAFQRHLAWEHRLFRRTYTTPDGKALPLYEAYAAIWASDNLQYNGGGAAHSSAYNIFAFRFAAALARLLGEDPTPYQTEADLINEAMQQFLWLPAQGAFAESKDLMEPQTVYSNPALWTVYHTIDSEVPTPRQAWQMGAERLAALRHVPIHGEGVPPNENLYMLSCSDWLPYMWSLNLLLLAENSHMALALWQAGMPDEAFRIFKGTLLDSMFMGLCPGDFHMTSALDAHRQESQRDFGDPIGITSRALVEGLFGIQPNLIANSIRIRPGFPTSWNRASLHHKDFDFAWQRGQLVPSPDKGNPYWPAGTISETYEFTSRLAKFVPVTLTIPARTTHIPTVLCNGTSVESAFDPNAVGSPLLTIKLPASRSYKISVKWEGHSPNLVPLLDREKIGSLFGDTLVHLDIKSVRVGDILNLPQYLWTTQIDDPQQALTKFRITSAGFHTIFANVDDGDCHWTYPISFNAKPAAPAFAAIPALAAAAHAEPLDLTPILKNQLNEIFTRTYDEPRSPYCSLAFPNNDLGGWANADNRATISDAGLRSANGLLHTPIGVDFRTPSGTAPNCLFLSYWKQDAPSTRLALAGHASGIYLLVAGTTLPQCSRMTHATVSVHYSGGTTATLPLRNPETWWPIEQDYLLDDFLFTNDAPLPPRVDLATGQTRILDPVAFHGRGRTVPGGAATILHLPLDPAKTLASLEVKSELYGIVIALLAATLVRT